MWLSSLPAPFIEEAMLFSSIFGIFVKNQLSIAVRVYRWVLCSVVLLVCSGLVLWVYIGFVVVLTTLWYNLKSSLLIISRVFWLVGWFLVWGFFFLLFICFCFVFPLVVFGTLESCASMGIFLRVCVLLSALNIFCALLV